MIITRNKVENVVHGQLFIYLHNNNNYPSLTREFFPFGYNITYGKENIQKTEYHKA
jgi:hypothetical protein